MSDLNPCFSAISLKFHKQNLFSATGEKVKISVVKQLIDEYHSLLEKEFILKLGDDNMPFIDEDNPAVQTESNPSSTVLKEISTILGLDYGALFQSRAPFVDRGILSPRHQIAHGRRRPIEYEDYVEVHDYIVSILDVYFNALVAEAEAKSYLVS